VLPASFKQVLSVRAVRMPLLGATIGRLQYAGSTLAILLLVQSATDSFASAGIVQACYSVGAAVGLPAQGRLVDRVGQTKVFATFAPLCAAGFAALVILAESEAPVAQLAAVSVLVGAAEPPLGTSMRTLWADLIEDARLRESAFALDAVTVELAFIVGPLVSALAIGLASPAAAVLVNAGLMVVGSLLYAASAASRSWRGGSHELGLFGPLRSVGVRVLMGISLGFGICVGAITLGITALATDEGHEQLAGALIAVQAVGSLAGGFWYGSRRWAGSPATRLPLLATAMALTILPLVLTPSLAVTFPLILLSGIALAPTIAAVYTMLDYVAPSGAATEATGWVLTALIVGAAAGEAFGGTAVGAEGAHAGMAVGVAGALVAVAVAWLCRPVLTRAGEATDTAAARA
jgi:predicted MFS family arabinose efflux permease